MIKTSICVNCKFYEKVVFGDITDKNVYHLCSSKQTQVYDFVLGIYKKTAKEECYTKNSDGKCFEFVDIRIK